MPGSWSDLRWRLERLTRDAQIAHRMITSAGATGHARWMCFSLLATSAGEAADLARRLADEEREALGEVP